MQPSRYLGPFAAPHKTPQFWSLVALLMIALLCAPFILPVLFSGLSAISFSSWLSSGAITLAVLVPVVWLAFRFGRVVWFLIGVAFVVLGLGFRGHP